MHNSLLAMLVLPVLAVPIVYILGRKIGKSVGWITSLPLLFVTSRSILFLLKATEEPVIFEEYAWTLAIKLKLGLLIDGLNLPVLFMLALVFAVVALYSIPYIERRVYEKYQAENQPAHATVDQGVGVKASGAWGFSAYYAAYLLYFTGVIGATLATNLIELYIFFELALISSWFLVNTYGYGEKRVAFTYFIWTHVGAVFLLAGILLTGLRVGSYEIADLSLLIGDPMAIWVATAILLCFFIKMAVVGFHAWLPCTYGEAPAPISAALGATSVGLGTYVVIRLLTPLRSVLFGISGWLELWALLTIIYGGLMALAESDLKRLVAYLSMSQMNYCLLGAFTYMRQGAIGAISYSVSHGLAIALLFLVAGSIFYRTGTCDINRLGGLAAKMPFAATASIIGFFTIGGVPPTIGFKSKFVLLIGAFERAFVASPLELTVAILAVMATMVTIAYELWAVWRVFYGSLPSHLQGIRESPLIMSLPFFTLALTSLILGIWPAIIVEPMEIAIDHLLGAV